MSQWCIRKSGWKTPWASHIHRLHPHWVPYLVPRFWQVLFEPCPLRTAFPCYYNLNVKCHPHSQRREHLFPSWGLILGGIYLEEEGHWLGGQWSPVRFLCRSPLAILSLLLYCGCRVSRRYMFMALQLPGHARAVSQSKPFLLNMPLVGTWR